MNYGTTKMVPEHYKKKDLSMSGCRRLSEFNLSFPDFEESLFQSGGARMELEVILSSEDALELWGLCMFGPLTRPGFKAVTPERSTYDKYVMISNSVERFFEVGQHRKQFRSLAKWVYADGNKASDFPWERPGVTRLNLLTEMGWIHLVGITQQPAHDVFRLFQARFKRWWHKNGIQILSEAPLVEFVEFGEGSLLLSTEGAADKLGRSISSVARLLKTGELLGFKRGARWVIPLTSVQHYLEQEANNDRARRRRRPSSWRKLS